MTLTEMREALRNLINEQRVARNESISLGADATAQQFTDAANRLANIQNRIDMMRDAIAAEEAAQRSAVAAPAAAPAAPVANQTRGNIRASREYTRAFFKALKNGYVPGRSAYQEQYKPLHDLLTESEGNRGGYLIPEEMDTMIRQFERELNELAALFGYHAAASNKGWLVTGKHAEAGFSKLGVTDAEGDRVARMTTSAAELFGRIPYALDTYGLLIPIENELLNDENSGVMSYLARLIAEKAIITKNTLLLATMPELPTAAFAASGDKKTVVDAIKTALNVTLDPAISRKAVILTNQDGFAVMDNLKDTTGRDLLQPMPGDPTALAIRGRRVVVASNAVLASGTNFAPIYVGDMKQYATLFERGPMEIVSNDVGAGAFENYETVLRAITRLDARTFDTAAATAIKVTI